MLLNVNSLLKSEHSRGQDFMDGTGWMGGTDFLKMVNFSENDPPE
jgi:hypothetical protein